MIPITYPSPQMAFGCQEKLLEEEEKQYIRDGYPNIGTKIRTIRGPLYEALLRHPTMTLFGEKSTVFRSNQLLSIANSLEIKTRTLVLNTRLYRDQTGIEKLDASEVNQIILLADNIAFAAMSLHREITASDAYMLVESIYEAGSDTGDFMEALDALANSLVSEGSRVIHIFSKTSQLIGWTPNNLIFLYRLCNVLPFALKADGDVERDIIFLADIAQKCAGGDLEVVYKKIFDPPKAWISSMRVATYERLRRSTYAAAIIAINTIERLVGGREDVFRITSGLFRGWMTTVFRGMMPVAACYYVRNTTLTRDRYEREIEAQKFRKDLEAILIADRERMTKMMAFAESQCASGESVLDACIMSINRHVPAVAPTIYRTSAIQRILSPSVQSGDLADAWSSSFIQSMTTALAVLATTDLQIHRLLGSDPKPRDMTHALIFVDMALCQSTNTVDMAMVLAQVDYPHHCDMNPEQAEKYAEMVCAAVKTLPFWTRCLVVQTAESVRKIGAACTDNDTPYFHVMAHIFSADVISNMLYADHRGDVD